jgi:hypothetical protein
MKRCRAEQPFFASLQRFVPAIGSYNNMRKLSITAFITTRFHEVRRLQGDWLHNVKKRLL